MQTQTTDRGVGLAVLAVILALASAGAMFAGAPDVTSVSAGGFGAAVVFGCLAIVALHAYPQ